MQLQHEQSTNVQTEYLDYQQPSCSGLGNTQQPRKTSNALISFGNNNTPNMVILSPSEEDNTVFSPQPSTVQNNHYEDDLDFLDKYLEDIKKSLEEAKKEPLINIADDGLYTKPYIPAWRGHTPPFKHRSTVDTKSTLNGVKCALTYIVKNDRQ